MSDISLTIGSETRQFDLAKEEKRKLFSTREEPIIPIKALSDIPSYGDLPPEKILAFVQNNWRGGMGQKHHFNIMDMYADGQNIDTRDPNQIILGPLINTMTLADTIILLHFFEGREYALSSTKIYKLSSDSASWNEVYDVATSLGETIECVGTYDGYIYVGLTGDTYTYSATGDSSSWVQPTLDNAIMHEITVAPSFTATKDILVLAKRPNEIRTATAPLHGEAGWTDPPYYVGDENSDITSVTVINGTLFIGKEDGLYALPADGRPVLVVSYKEQKHSSNFAFYTNWQGIFYGSAVGDILEVIAGSSSMFSVDYMGPLERSPELATIGDIKSITSGDKNIYALFLIGSNYIIYIGRERRDNKHGLRWEWTPYVYLGTNACAAIKVTQRSGASPKLWFAYGSAMAYVILAKAPNFPLGDSAYRYCAQGFLITTYFDAFYDTWLKVFYQLWSIAENLAAGITIVVYYQKDAQSSWTTLTTITANGVQSVDLAALSCKRIRLKLELNSGTNTITPVLREFIYRGVLQPEITKTLDFTVVLGQSNTRKPSSDMAFLEGGRTATAPIVLKDFRFGTTRYITYLPNSPMETEAIDEASKQPSYRAKIVAQQLNWTKP